MIDNCPVCRRAVANDERITHTAAGWVHSCCASGDGPTRTGETITNHLYHYVSVKSDDTGSARRGLLLGPYLDRETALANVERGKRLAHNAGDPQAVWYLYGTASSNRQYPTLFGL